MTCLTFEEFQRREESFQQVSRTNCEKLREEIRSVHGRQEEYHAAMTAKLDAFDTACEVVKKQGSIHTMAQKVQELKIKLNRLHDVERYLSTLVAVERIKYLCWSLTEKKGGIGLLKELKTLLKEPTPFKAVHDYVSQLEQWSSDAIESQLKARFGEQLKKMDWPKPIEIGKWKGREMEMLLKTLDNYLIFSSICGDSNLAQRAITVLVEPIKVRFLFHFATERPTNRLDKPEWFLSHLAQEIAVHLPMVECCFELDVEGSDSVVATFVNALCDLAQKHLMKRCPHILTDPHLLLHTVSQVGSFASAVTASSGVDCTRILTEFLEASFDEWIAAQVESSSDSLQSILHDSPTWNEEALESPESTGQVIDKFIPIADDLIDILFGLPAIAHQIAFIGDVINPLFNTLYASLDYDIPAFYSTLEDVRILILMGNSLAKVNERIENDWGGALKAIEIGESQEFEEGFGYTTTGLTASIFNRILVAFRGLYTRILDHLHSYLWHAFHSPVSSFIKSMHYGIIRDRTVIRMHDDLRKALVNIAESVGHVKPYMHPIGMDLIEAQFLESLSTLLFDRLILQNFFRPESIPQLREDLQTIKWTFAKLMPAQPVARALERSEEAATLLGMGEVEYEHLQDSLRMEDLDEAANVMGALHINRLSLGDCERILSLLRF